MTVFAIVQATIAREGKDDLVEDLERHIRSFFGPGEIGFVVRGEWREDCPSATSAQDAAMADLDPGILNPNERARLAEAVAILVNAVAGLSDPSIVAHRRLMLPALRQAGRAFILLGEAEHQDDLKTVCARLIERHNARVVPAEPDDSSRPRGRLIPPEEPER